MGKWPKGLFEQAMIAVCAAAVVSIVVFVQVKDELFQQYAREAPHDGQDGLAAFMGAIHTGFYAFVGVSIGVFILQRVFTVIGIGDSKSPTE